MGYTELKGHYVAFGTALLTFLNDPSLCVSPKLRRIDFVQGALPIPFPPLTGLIEALQIERGTIAEHVTGSGSFATAPIL
ncbi:hypothetical protein F9K84_05830 [Brucella anthropi]|uniref:hypothetical protein n=1 Tax=Brucella anthropi TaxID=529 RepID=UPI00124CC002|nr:hypothetical protein [Brucella anthropi]KAB2770265.1 hypothetical protein F9K84_05830 [Brucella anthropi]